MDIYIYIKQEVKSFPSNIPLLLDSFEVYTVSFLLLIYY